MNTNKRMLIYTFAACILLLMIPVIYYAVLQYQKTHFSCFADYSAVNGGKRFISKSSLIVNGDSGTWMMDGKISAQGQAPDYFKLRNRFHLERTDFSYHFLTRKVLISSENNAAVDKLNEFLANVITKPGADSFFYIYRIGENYVVTSGDTPILFCNK